MRRLTSQRMQCDERGVSAIFVVLCMLVLVGMGALVVDVGAVYAERRVLQNGADAAALAVARDCAGGACGAMTATANQYADANAGDGATAIEDVSVNATARTVTVETLTEASDGGGGLPMVFAGVLGFGDQQVRAVATATWGPPASAPVRPLAMSLCEFNDATSDGTRFASAPFNGTPRTIRFHRGSGSNQIADCSAKAGHDTDGDDRLSGGFGWLDATACTATLTTNSVASAEPGNSVGKTCTAADFRDQTVLLPVYDDVWGTGNNGRYHIAGWAAFRVTGFRFPNWSWNAPCSSPTTCIAGHFTRYVTEGSVLGGGDFGVMAVHLTS